MYNIRRAFISHANSTLIANDIGMQQSVFRNLFCTQILVTLSLLCTETALVIPAAYHSVKLNGDAAVGGGTANLTWRSAIDPGSDLDVTGLHGLLVISRGTAIILLGVYVAYLVFQVSA